MLTAEPQSQGTVMERYLLAARHPSSPSHVPLPEQTLHPSMLRLLLIPQLPACCCLPLLACSLPLHTHACSHRGRCSAGAFGEDKQGVLERAHDGRAADKGNVASRLLGSLSALPLAHQLQPGTRGLISTLNCKGTGHPSHKVIYPSSEIMTLEQRGQDHPWGCPHV